MDNIFRIEVDTGNGGYGFTDTLTELLADVDMEYGTKEVKKVSECGDCGQKLDWSDEE